MGLMRRHRSVARREPSGVARGLKHTPSLAGRDQQWRLTASTSRLRLGGGSPLPVGVWGPATPLRLPCRSVACAQGQGDRAVRSRVPPGIASDRRRAGSWHACHPASGMTFIRYAVRRRRRPAGVTSYCGPAPGRRCRPAPVDRLRVVSPRVETREVGVALGDRSYVLGPVEPASLVVLVAVQANGDLTAAEGGGKLEVVVPAEQPSS